jgi:hypothetical protein
LPAASSTGAPLTFLASIRRSASLCRCGEKREHEHGVGAPGMPLLRLRKGAGWSG